MMRARSRAAKSKDSQVENLLRKTIENGATPGEEVAAVQLAHMVVRQNGLDLDVFKAALAKIGDPPRYVITHDGFLLPVRTLPAANAVGAGRISSRMGSADEEDGPARTNVAADESCLQSPTGLHRMERHMQGTVSTGALYCIHCGFRTATR
jgi:hypothetical protein